MEEDQSECAKYLIDPIDVEFHELIDEGSTAAVFRAKLRGDQCVVKKITDLRDSSVTVFERELRVLCRVRHPHIVTFFGIIDSDEAMQLCLEYCQGGCLYDLLYTRGRNVPLAWRQRIIMLYDIASAVDYLHSFTPKLLHRDLKSLNVLLAEPVRTENDEPFVKVCDFGFAREFQASMTLGAGTSHWMAPEVTAGTEYAENADTFSFAMLIYEVMCRRVPFADMDPKLVPHLISSGVRPGLTMTTASGHTPEIPDGLMDLMQRCWEQLPSMRPDFHTVCLQLCDISNNMPDCLKRTSPEPLVGEQCSL